MLDAFGLPVYATDAAGRILHYNDEAAALWGRRPEIGKDMWCGSWKIFSPEGIPIPLDACPMAITLRENRPIRDAEILVERPDGSRSLIRPYPSPLRDETGRLVGAVNILLDITAQRRGEEASARLAAIVTSSNDAIVAKDLDGIVTSWNGAAETMFGYSAAEAVGKSIRLIIPEDRQNEEDRVLESIRRGERIEHFETIRRRKDGKEIPVSLSVSPVMTSNGHIVGASSIARDISERKKAEEALRQAQEIKNDFLSLVSHELRSPLSTILGNAMLLRRRAQHQGDADLLRALDDVVSSARRLDGYVENLLIFQRLEAGQLELEPVSLPALAVKAIEAFQSANPGRNVSFNSKPEIKPCLGQEALVSLVIQNLLSNANKYSPPDTEIEVVITASNNGDPELHVMDHGIGLDEEAKASIFTPFYRSTKARAQAGGMGLGLAVCKRAMEALGGSIGGQGRPLGGSDFYICLKAEC
jgi:PAS domain S-box-containing protein